ncbi:uncharacterized protein LOC136080484 isoform X2 [Hydra vulgaris]|uniref:Metalloendopeptidase n=1 Tax=Hydra vulgaris TaxID=6087 RepID=A0ABM4BVP1_HYDVU
MESAASTKTLPLKRVRKNSMKLNDMTTIVDEFNGKQKQQMSIEEINTKRGRYSDIDLILDNENKRSGKAINLWIENGTPRIPYTIKVNKENNCTGTINEVVRSMNKYLCHCKKMFKIQDVWVKKSNNDSIYVEFDTTQQRGCQASRGKEDNVKVHKIYLENLCCTKGTILHEMLHLMGMPHEHNRCDRSAYVDIVWQNLNNSDHKNAKSVRYQFEEDKRIQTYYTPYDIFSIMHYGLWAASIHNGDSSKQSNNTKTIIVNKHFMNLPRKMEELIGNLWEMSDTDKREINIVYGCIKPECIISCNGKKVVENNCTTFPPTTKEAMLSESIIIQNYELLNQGKMVSRIDVLEKNFHVRFSMHPNGVEGSGNIIHLTVNSSKLFRGKEIIGVWYSENNKTFNISVLISDKYITVLSCFKDPSVVDIRQEQLKDRKYIYTIMMNEIIIHSEENLMPKEFQNVQVYASNPWDPSMSSMQIKDLFISNGVKGSLTNIVHNINPTDKIFELSRHLLNQNKVIGTIDTYYPNYTVSFIIKPLSYSNEWESVLHVTKGNNFGEYGDRSPAVFFNKDGTGRLSIFSSINGEINCQYTTNTSLPLKAWTRINISQSLENDVYIYRIKVNETEVYKRKNTEAKTFQNMKVYAADPWYSTHNGIIKELMVYNGDPTKIFNRTTFPKDNIEDYEERKLQKKVLIATVRYPKFRFVLSFKVKPIIYLKENNRIITLATLINSKNVKFIAVSFCQMELGKLCFLYLKDEETEETVFQITNDQLPLNTWSSIKIEREYDNLCRIQK